MSFWSRFFGKCPKELFLSFGPQDSNWRVVSWNFDLKSQGERLWVVEVSGNEKLSIEWERGLHDTIKFFREEELIRKRRGPEGELRVLMNLVIHSTIKFSLEENHEFMLTPVSGATTLDVQNEIRALLWIQASFGTLARALDRINEDPLLLLTAAFFAGIEPSTGERVLRMLAMNLDIFFYLKPDFSLLVAIFDDKGAGHGSGRAPVYQQIIKVTKPQFYDEIVKLVHKLAVVGEVK